MAVVTESNETVMNWLEHQYLDRHLSSPMTFIYKAHGCYNVELMHLLWSTVVNLVSTLSVDLK